MDLQKLIAKPKKGARSGKAGEKLEVVGKSVLRVDGWEKIKGAAKYTDDLEFGPALLYAAVVESPFAHARIKSIDISKAEKLHGVVKVVTGKSFTHKFGLYMTDRYVFATDTVRFVGEQVAAVVASDPKTAMRGAALVEVKYEELSEKITPRPSRPEKLPPCALVLPPARHQYRALAQDPQGRPGKRL
jgi:CO/xanthine dehydrogenase Mo-binding subunit